MQQSAQAATIDKCIVISISMAATVYAYRIVNARLPHELMAVESIKNLQKFTLDKHLINRAYQFPLSRRY